MKKAFILSISCTILIAHLSYAQTASGTIENISWSLDGDVLTISGTGAIPTYEEQNSLTTAPWRSYAANINSIVVSDGVTDLGQYAFKGIAATNISLGKDVAVIGQYALAGTNIGSLTLPDSVTQVATGALDISTLRSLTIPETTIFSDKYVFPEEKSSLVVYCKGNTSTCDSHLLPYGIHTQLAQNNPSQGQKSGGHKVHRIYTVEEANEVAGEINTFRIKYR